MPSTPIATGNNPVVSPDGQTVAYDRGGQIYTIPIAGGTETALTGAVGSEPAWSRDALFIYYKSGAPDPTPDEIMKIAYPAGGIPTNLTNNAAVDQDPAVSPDGSTVAFSSDRTSGRFEIWVMDSGGGSLNQARAAAPAR